MGAVVRSGEVHHAVDTGKSGSATAIAMRIELLFRQNITAVL
jgi:hypothetical protein